MGIVILNQPHHRIDDEKKFPDFYEAENVVIPIGMDYDEKNEWYIYFSVGPFKTGEVRGGVMKYEDFQDLYDPILCEN